MNSLQSPFVITVSGDPVAGKSTAIKALMEKYNEEGFYCSEDINEEFSNHDKLFVRISAGQLFRKLASHAGRSLDEVRALAKKHYSVRSLVASATDTSFFNNLTDEDLDKSIDAFVDEYMINTIHTMQEKCSHANEAIIVADTRIAGLLMNLRNEPCMKIRLSVQYEIAARRLVKDSSNRPEEFTSSTKKFTLEDAFNSIKRRSDEDRARFIATYSKDVNNQEENAKVDLINLNNYDLVINTSGTTIPNEIKVLYSCIENARNGKEYEPNWRSTKYIYPGSPMSDMLTLSSTPLIYAAKSDNQYYAVNGQEYVGIGNHNGYKHELETGNEDGYPLIPVRTVAEKDEFMFIPGTEGKTVEQYIKDNINQELVNNFEKEYGFKYPDHGMAPLKSASITRNSGINR